MLLQAFAHEFASVMITELGTTPITSNRFHAFSIDSIAGSTTVELIERQELVKLASISGSLLNTTVDPKTQLTGVSSNL